jgi:hypothetical protein
MSSFQLAPRLSFQDMLQVTHLAPGKGQMLHLCNPCYKGCNGLLMSHFPFFLLHKKHNYSEILIVICYYWITITHPHHLPHCCCSMLNSLQLLAMVHIVSSAGLHSWCITSPQSSISTCVRPLSPQLLHHHTSAFWITHSPWILVEHQHAGVIITTSTLYHHVSVCCCPYLAS